MRKELRLSENNYSAIEEWDREISEEYEEIEYLDGYFEIGEDYDLSIE